MIPCIEAWIDDAAGLRKAGTAFFTLRAGRILTRFTYDQAFLSSKDVFQISPDLPLSEGGGHADGLPASFRDSAPDRWGRRLIDKKNRREAEDIPRQLDEVDYLLGVSDSVREGALRFKAPGGSWLGADSNIPPVVDLPELLDASRRVLSDEETHEELKQLLDAGSGSLGGARPKASVMDGEKLLLAKFSRDSDDHDVIGIEKTLIELMPLCGIDAPSSRLLRFGNQAVLLLERFDRTFGNARGVRIPYMSAMSLLGLHDGQQASYLDVLERINELCGASAVEQMLRRICFSIAVNNTDDHLRNHGLLFVRGSWRLAPCFDVNPNLYRSSRETPVLGGTLDEWEQFQELAALFGFSPNEIEKIERDVAGTIGYFEEVARRNRVPEKTLCQVRDVFEACRPRLRV